MSMTVEMHSINSDPVTLLYSRVNLEADSVLYLLFILQMSLPLEPLLLQIARDFTDDVDLSDRIHKIFLVRLVCL
jgi:hypothetical protein